MNVTEDVKETINSNNQSTFEMDRINKITDYDRNLVSNYLVNRGIKSYPTCLEDCVKTHPEYAYYEDGQETGKYPTLFFPIKRVDGELVGYSKIFLDPETLKKADVPSPKKFTRAKYPQAYNGAAVQLMDIDSNTMAIAEGIETALAVSAIKPELSVWATLSAHGMKTFEPPENIRKIYIFADNDKKENDDGNVTNVGLDAANELAWRLCINDISVYILVPFNSKTDWLDELNEFGAAYTRETVDIAIHEKIGLIDPKNAAPDSVKYMKYKTKKSQPHSNEDIDGLILSTNEKDIIKYMNHYHFIVRVENKVKIACIEIEDGVESLKFLGATDFHLKYQSWKLKDKKTTASRFWINCPERRGYDKTSFAPGQQISDNVYNTFHGWPRLPRRGNCSTYLEHVRDIICARDNVVYDYVIRWMAHLFQKPEELPEIALLLTGAPGTGKSMFASILGELVGPYFCKLTNAHQLSGKFSGHLQNRLLVFADEFDMANKKTTLLNAMITEKVIPIERKGIDISLSDNFMRLILASNDDTPFILHAQDRRFLPLPVSNERQQDYDFFHALIQEMENGGYEALMFLLMDIDLTAFNVRKIPLGKKKFEMIMDTADSFTQWLYYWLDSPEQWANKVMKDNLFFQYSEWADANNLNVDLTKMTFGKQLHKIFPDHCMSDNRQSFGNTRKRSYSFAGLSKCREAFQNYYKSDSDIWEAPADTKPVNVKASRLP